MIWMLNNKKLFKKSIRKKSRKQNLKIMEGKNNGKI